MLDAPICDRNCAVYPSRNKASQVCIDLIWITAYCDLILLQNKDKSVDTEAFIDWAEYSLKYHYSFFHLL